MVHPVAAQSLADGELVGDDPREVPRDDPRGPLSLHVTTSSPTMRIASTAGATSRTRPTLPPAAAAQTQVAIVPSSRSSSGAPPASAPRNPFRLVPIRTGCPGAT